MQLVSETFLTRCDALGGFQTIHPTSLIPGAAERNNYSGETFTTRTSVFV